MLDMSDTLKLLQDLQVPVTGSIVKDAASAGRYYVFVAVTRNSENRQNPSNKWLSEVKEKLAQQKVEVDFILTDGHQRDAEAGLRATLLHSFGSSIRNVFLSTEGSAADVWLDPKIEIETDVLAAIGVKTGVFLADVGMEVRSISTTTSQNLPTKTALMRTIRQLSPVRPERLAENLRQRDFTVPSDDWLARKLDALRKGGLVVRLSNGRYALSLVGLRAMGTAKNASSPDLTRLLALAAGRH